MKNWKKAIVSSKLSIEKSIQKLDEVGLRILIICGKNYRLMGLVTDGDIRRAIIDKIDLKLPIKKIMSSKPIFGKSTDSFENLQKLMKENNIIHLPVIKNNKIINLITVNDKEESNDLNNTILILAGGYGKRLYPITKKIPKPLIKIQGKSVLENLLIKVTDSGFQNIFISTFYKSELIKEKVKQKKFNVHFLKEKKPLGTAGSIGLIPKKYLTKPIIVLNSDLVTDVNFEKLLKFHVDSKNDATIVAKSYEMSSPYAELTVKNRKIINLVEKPKYTSLVNTGIYVLNFKFIKNISGKKRIDMTDVIKNNIKKKFQIGYYPIYEKWIDIGSFKDLEKARKIIN